jgi:hypothetical protein
MTNAARLTDAEVAMLTRRLRNRPELPPDRPRASVIDIATHRAPLGLAIVDGPDEPPERSPHGGVGRPAGYPGAKASAKE